VDRFVDDPTVVAPSVITVNAVAAAHAIDECEPRTPLDQRDRVRHSWLRVRVHPSSALQPAIDSPVQAVQSGSEAINSRWRQAVPRVIIAGLPGPGTRSFSSVMARR
jgi:hypothetical protein